jgi:phosphoserine phosphatase
MDETLLITVTGRDEPGLTTGLFAVLAAHGASVVDVEQVTVRDRLLLGILVGVRGDATSLRAAVAARAQELGVSADFDVVSGRSTRDRTVTHHVTLLAPTVSAEALAAVTAEVAACGANIEGILRLSDYPLTSYELHLSGGSGSDLRVALAATGTRVGVDVAVQRAGLHLRAKRLVVMDVDSTLVQGEVIELLAEQAGHGDEVARITEAAMRGELDFEASLRARVRLLEGLPLGAVDEVRRSLRLMPGAQTLVRTLKRLGYVTAIVSGGFTQVTDSLVERLGLDHAAANTLEVVDGRLTGGLVGPVIDRPGKAAALERFAATAGVPLSATVAIGDGANDLDMLAKAGLGIAFNAKPVVRAAADTAVSGPFLDAVLFVLGIPRGDVEAADAADAEGVPLS